MTRLEASWKVDRGLREFGYPDITGEIIKDVLDEWLAGKRDFDLPHGVIGVMAGRQFDDIEDAVPGSLALLAA